MMKYFSAVCGFLFTIIYHPYIVASMEFDLEPTPLAFQPSGMKVNGQVRDPCYVNCASLNANIRSAQLALDDASYALAAHQSIAEKASGFCAGGEYGPAFYLNIEGVDCPPGYQSEIAAVKATQVTIQHITSTPDPSFN